MSHTSDSYDAEARAAVARRRLVQQLRAIQRPDARRSPAPLGARLARAALDDPRAPRLRRLGQLDVRDLDLRRADVLAQLDLLRATSIAPNSMPRVNVALMRSTRYCASSSLDAEALDDPHHAVLGKQPRELLGDVLADVAALGFGLRVGLGRIDRLGRSLA